MTPTATIPAPALREVHTDTNGFAPLLVLIDTLVAAARSEGRAMAGSTADDLPPLREACAATDRVRAALILALDELTAGGAR